jgi:hypothetical protein
VQKEFQADKAAALVAMKPVRLDAEQVMLNLDQVQCGIKDDLWDPPVEASERTVAHLNPAAKALNFDDDIVVTEPGYNKPYAQVRGNFTATMIADGAVVREDGPNARRVVARVLVTINHSCFPDPLPLIGVHHGKFDEDVLPVLHFSLDGEGWHFDRVEH